MFGSCHGERLPPFPAATHGRSPGLKPFVTAREVLQRIEDTPNVTLHNPDDMSQLSATPWNENGLLVRSITCNGGQNYHPSGQRKLTLREFASFQGFPEDTKFCAPQIQRQIGNAFPPCVVKVFYDHLWEWLLKEDSGKEAIIIIESDEDLEMTDIPSWDDSRSVTETLRGSYDMDDSTTDSGADKDPTSSVQPNRLLNGPIPKNSEISDAEMADISNPIDLTGVSDTESNAGVCCA